MEFEKQFGEIASLIGDKSRAIMLWHLLDGRAYTATELSLCADISPQSASNHLLKLVSASLLTVEKQGRHRYYRYSHPDVARAIESMAVLLPLHSEQKRKERTDPSGITYIRTCYDHIAGKIGVEIATSLIRNKIIEEIDQCYEITPYGKEWFASIGITIDQLKLQKRSFAYPCLDWSERKHHLAGALGAALLETLLQNDWVRRIKNSRELVITTKGKTELKDRLNLIIC